MGPRADVDGCIKSRPPPPPPEFDPRNLQPVASHCANCSDTIIIIIIIQMLHINQILTSRYGVMSFDLVHVLCDSDRLCGLVVRVSGYSYRGPGFDPRRYQIF